MTGPYPHTHGRDDPSAPPLSELYLSPDPVDWHGTPVHPMFFRELGTESATVTLTLRTVVPPPGLRGVGIGLAVSGGHVEFEGRVLRGVDVWADAMTGGVQLALCPDDTEAAFSLTPVWMSADGTVTSWSGNYGMVIEHDPRGIVVLHCSVGVGAVEFSELVVELATAPPSPEAERYRRALYELAVAMHGRGDVEQACQLWRQAAGFGHAGAAYDLGVVRFRLGEHAEAERWWRAAAGHGDARAMAGLAEVLDRRGNAGEARAWRASAAAVPA
ncbi:tetratricopeptide repeat protein [Nocardia stercoris]|uniref:Tetratricopeptide repeat protein n=1 Tax=Nocardia stercoris TaxID=2483361 RepID=A0A3M2L6P7_9NOCA|nr:tetratricopeptide repeat protein [Nocardia stercoris]RMI33329.1 tetratricopeptide repeat protein [Nocardia stercoris]